MNLPRLSLGVCPTPEQVGSDGAVTPRLGGMRWGKTVCPRVSMVCVPPCIRGLPRVGGVYLAGPDGHGCGGLCGGDGPKPGGGWDGMNLPRLNVGVCPTPEQVGSDGAVTPKGGVKQCTQELPWFASVPFYYGAQFAPCILNSQDHLTNAMRYGHVCFHTKTLWVVLMLQFTIHNRYHVGP